MKKQGGCPNLKSWSSVSGGCYMNHVIEGEFRYQVKNQIHMVYINNLIA